ncbi:MAG: hypothetical protein AB1704_20880 [Pseudomonadota bacterium]
MKALERIIIGSHVFALIVVALLLADHPIYQFVLTIYCVMHRASIPAELLYVFICLRLRTSFVPDNERHGISPASRDDLAFSSDQA